MRGREIPVADLCATLGHAGDLAHCPVDEARGRWRSRDAPLTGF